MNLREKQKITNRLSIMWGTERDKQRQKGRERQGNIEEQKQLPHLECLSITKYWVGFGAVGAMILLEPSSSGSLSSIVWIFFFFESDFTRQRKNCITLSIPNGLHLSFEQNNQLQISSYWKILEVWIVYPIDGSSLCFRIWRSRNTSDILL